MMQQKPNKAIHWDGTITAGNVLTAGAMLCALIVWGLRLEGRVDLQEERQLRFEATATAQRNEDKATEHAAFVELRAALRRIEDILLQQARDTRRTP